MKNFTQLLLLILLSPFICFSQDFPSYGVISNEEFDLKECIFDKDANAIVLLDEAESDYDDNRHLITNRHIRIKILKERGFSAANVEIYFYRKEDFEAINRLEAMITNVNANGDIVSEKVSNKSIYKKEENERFGKMIFTFPGVKVGSIIEYKYQSFMKHYGGLRDWYFQSYLPVLKSKYTLKIAPNLEFTYKVKKSEDRGIIIKQPKGSGQVYFEMNDIPALENEPYMDAREDYIQKINFQVSGFNRGDGFGKQNYNTTWDEVIKELQSNSNFGGLLNKNIPGTKDIIETVKDLSEEDKMKTIYNFVRNKIKWNGLNSIYAAEGLKEPWSKQQGTSGEINLILNNLLKEAGLETYPILVSERFHGKVNIDYPFLDQFNTVLACVIIKGKKYYLNATDTYIPAHITPQGILNTTALIVNKKIGGLISIINDSLLYNDFMNMQMNVAENGNFSGEVYVKNDGYSRIEKVESYKNSGQEKYIEGYFKKEGMQIQDFEFLNQSNDSMPVEQKFKFSTNLGGSGDYLYIPLNLFSGFERNPFISDNRFSNINFGYKRTISTNATIRLPENYKMDALPKSIKMITPDKDVEFLRTVEYDKESNSVLCMFKFDFKKSLYTVDEYPILQEVYKKMFEYLKEPLLLKKK